MPIYTGLFTDEFNKLLNKKYRHLKERVKELVDRILEDPYLDSHLLDKKKGIDLRGKRSRHLTGNFVVVYVVCEECVEKGKEFRARGFNQCSHCPENPGKQVVFLAFAKHDDIYSRTWKT
jgi:mRNA-degrading endonuclease RelE of RelBE toxin-antitoxin system